MKHVSIILLFLLVIVVNITFAQAGYSVEPHSSIRPGPVDSLGADRDVSFFELPLWIQIAEISGFLVALFSAIKFGPVLVGKVKTILQTKIRAEILEYIRRHPGCTIADLSKKTGINRGSVKYHLSVLVIERKIVRKKEGKLMFLFT
ncbi:MAG TPA: winged helix-turn-helix transcriptional regulator, partial [Methanoregula sp.]|nr:winged helix-turn-helix transcriptional regulator [Methanoregula sp.]